MRRSVLPGRGPARRKKRGLFRRGSGRGQAVVELALLLPVLLFLIMGILDFARAYNVLQVVTQAARSGARVAVIPTSTDAQVQAAATNITQTVNMPCVVPVQANWGTNGAAGAAVQVQVTCNFQTFTGTIISNLVPFWTGVLPLSHTVTMRHE